MAWKQVTEARYDEMLGAVPPAVQARGGFLVGEAYDHRIIDGRLVPTFRAFMRINGLHYECSDALTVAEFRAVNLATVAA